MNRIRFTFLALVVALSGCGAGVSGEDTVRSTREYELGVGLMNEGSAPMAFQHLLEAVRLDPNNCEAHTVLGVLYTARHDYTEANTHLAKALALAQVPSADVRPSMKAEIHNNLGVLRLEEGRVDDAIMEFRAATGDLLYTTPYLAWANLGLAYYRKQDFQESLRALEQAVSLQHDFCLGYLRLGQTYLALRDFDKAEISLTRVVDVENPTCNRTQEAWRLRGEARAQLGHRADATSDFEHCVELGSDNEAGLACRRFLEAAH